MKRLFYLTYIALILLYSCATVQKGEKEIWNDATPPPDYKPVFIQAVQDFNPSVDKPKLIVSGINSRKPNSVQAKIHLVADDKIILRGAHKPEFRNIWCLVEDSINGKWETIKNFKISEVTEENAEPMSLAIVTDHSGSMGDWRAEALQTALKNIIEKKRGQDNFSIIKYDSKVITESPLSSSKDEILLGFKQTKLVGYGGFTAICDGILAGINELMKSPKNQQKSILIFTDGWDNSSTVRKDSVIELALMNNIFIYGIDFGEGINTDFIRSFVDSTGGYYQHIYKTDEFDLVFEDIYKRLNNSYILEFNPVNYGVHHLRLKLCLPNDTITTMAVYDNTPNIGTVGMLNIYFDFDKATFKKESEVSINSIFALMKGFPKMVIEIGGHTDSLNSTKDPEYNIKLSSKRAEAVKKALVKMGIEDSRISAKGFGETQPVSDNTTEEGRALNRRTEFIVLKK